MEIGLPLTGFVVGLLIGLTSMGGAALMTPFLILVLGVRPVIAVGTDLAYCAVTKLVGAWVHWRQGTVDVQVVRRLACGSLPGALLGVLMVGGLHRGGLDPDKYVRLVLGVVLVVASALFILRSVGSGQALLTGPFLRRWVGTATVAWGSVVGFIVAVTSVGSGSLVVPFLLILYPMLPAQVVGTDVFHAALLVSVTAAGHASIGSVDWHLAVALLSGSLPGVILGSYLAPRLPAGPLRVGLACVLLASGLKLV